MAKSVDRRAVAGFILALTLAVASCTGGDSNAPDASGGERESGYGESQIAPGDGAVGESEENGADD